jgi:hypothetical protein
MSEVEWLMIFMGLQALAIVFLSTRLLEHKSDADYWKESYLKSQKSKGVKDE